MIVLFSSAMFSVMNSTYRVGPDIIITVSKAVFEVCISDAFPRVYLNAFLYSIAYASCFICFYLSINFPRILAQCDCFLPEDGFWLPLERCAIGSCGFVVEL